MRIYLSFLLLFLQALSVVSNIIVLILLPVDIFTNIFKKEEVFLDFVESSVKNIKFWKP